jgi:amidase
MEIAATITDEQAAAAREVAAQALSRMDELATPGTVLALPTAPSLAPPLETSSDELESFRVRVMRLVCMGSISGLPQVSIPVGTVGGAPIGLSFLGWHGGDEALLELATTVAPLVGAAISAPLP